MPRVCTDRDLVRESNALFRLLTQTIEAPRKKQDCQNDKQKKEKMEKDDSK